MQNGLFIRQLYNMQDVPRWDEHAPNFLDDAAMHSYRCAKIGVLVGLLENYKFNKLSVDKEKVVFRALLHDLNETKTGSIKYYTKKHELVADKIKNIERQASEEIVSYLSKSIRPFFYDGVVNGENLDEVEGRIVKDIDAFDALLFCKREKESESSIFFAEKYVELYNELKESEFESIRYLVSVIHSSGMVNGEDLAYWKIIENTMEMGKIRRWKGKMNLVADSNATHTFRMTVIAMFNALVEKVKFGNEEVNVYEVVCKCLFHDLIEAVSGDVLGPLKHSSEETKLAFEEFERVISETMLVGLPEKEKEWLQKFLVESKSKDMNGELVNIADKIDAMIKARLEMVINPSVYANSFKKQLKNIQHNFENESTKFFLSYIMHDIYFSE